MVDSCEACGAPWALRLFTWALCAAPGCRLFDQKHLDSLQWWQVHDVQMHGREPIRL